MAVKSINKISPCNSDLDFDEPKVVELESIAKEVSEKISSKREGGFDATQMYLGEIGASPLLTAEEEVYFSRKLLKGDESSRKRMIESNLRLVVKIARRYMNRGLALAASQNQRVTQFGKLFTESSPIDVRVANQALCAVTILRTVILR